MILNYNVQPRFDKNHRLEQYYIPLLDILTWNSFSRCRHCISSAFSLLFKLFWTAVLKHMKKNNLFSLPFMLCLIIFLLSDIFFIIYNKFYLYGLNTNTI